MKSVSDPSAFLPTVGVPFVHTFLPSRLVQMTTL